MPGQVRAHALSFENPGERTRQRVPAVIEIVNKRKNGVGKISVREFGWHHLFTLYRYRHQVLSLDSELFLTHGGPVSPASMLMGLNPTRGISMGVCSSTNGEPALIGQMLYTPGERSAHLSFLAPASACDSPSLPTLLDYFAVQAGARGAFHLLAELEEQHPAFVVLRRAGFSVYAWQRIWRFPLPADARGGDMRLWRYGRAVDEPNVRSLYQLLVPPLVQAAEPLSDHVSRGLVYRQGDEVMAFVEAVYGPKGIFLHPIIHPDVGNVTELLADLVHNLPMRLGRPVYLSVRSYQAWLETSLQQLDGEFATRQALMVKHLVKSQRVEALSPRLAVMENRQAEPASIVPSIYHSKN